MMNLLLCSAEMTAVSLIYMVILRLLKDRQAPVLRYYSWFIIVGGFLMPFKPHLGTSEIILEENFTYIMHTTKEHYGRDNTHISQTFEHYPPINNVLTILFFIWLVGAVLYLCYFIAGAVTFRKSIDRLSRPADHDTQLLAEQISSELGICERVRVVFMREITTPMLTGLTAPIILLPDRAFEPDELMLILRHELTHYKHEDLKLRLFFTLCRAVHWFNPIMRFIGRSIDEECEHYCDWSVMKNEPAEVRKCYCNSILNTVSAQKKAWRGVKPVLATNFFTPKQGLKHRLELILSGSRKRRYIFIGLVCVVLTILSGSVISVYSETWSHSDPIVYKYDDSEDHEVTVTTAVYPDMYDVPDVSAVTTVTAVSPDETIYVESAPLNDDSEAWNRYYEEHSVTTAPMPQDIVMME
jgi:beta-lactamase regulating signal transducer with metallopeptidase domain